MNIDYDQPDPRLVTELVARYEESAARLRDRVLNPPGSSDRAREWNQARAAQILGQVDAEIARLRKMAADWTGAALEASMRRGIATADHQAEASGIVNAGSPLKGTFSIVDRGAVEVLAKDTVGDLIMAANSMRSQAKTVLHRMAATGVTNAEVNAILTGGVIEGRPRNTIRELREALKKVHGKQVTITDRNDNQRTFDAGYYARMVAVTKTREATCMARHARLADRGIDLVTVVGRKSVNFCTAYLHKVFSISGGHKKYPPLSALPGGGPPFHPNCSKSTAPFIEALADPQEIEAGKPDPDTDKLLNVQDRSELQRRFNMLQGKQQAEARGRSIRGRSDAGRKVQVSETDDPKYLAGILREMGVEEVDLGRHSDVGAMVVRGIQQVVSAGGAVPKSIVVDQAAFPVPNKGDIGWYDYRMGQMAFNPKWPGWRDGGKTMRVRYQQGQFSSDHPLHVVYHEAAHAHAAALNVNHRREKFSDADELSVAESVSRRAGVNKDEFLAEVRAARMAGRRFGKDILNLYERLGGR